NNPSKQRRVCAPCHHAMVPSIEDESQGGDNCRSVGSEALTTECASTLGDGVGLPRTERLTCKLPDDGACVAAKVGNVIGINGPSGRRCAREALSWIRRAAETRCQLLRDGAARSKNVAQCLQTHLSVRERPVDRSMRSRWRIFAGPAQLCG